MAHIESPSSKLGLLFPTKPDGSRAGLPQYVAKARALALVVPVVLSVSVPALAAPAADLAAQAQSWTGFAFNVLIAVLPYLVLGAACARLHSSLTPASPVYQGNAEPDEREADR